MKHTPHEHTLVYGNVVGQIPVTSEPLPREPHANRLKSQPDIYGLQLRMGMNPHADRDGYQEEADRAETRGGPLGS